MNTILNGSVNKAIVALAVGVIVLVATRYGLNLDQSTQEALTTLITALAVYFVPNK